MTRQKQPVGQITLLAPNPVQRPRAKYSAFLSAQIISITKAVPSLKRGGSRSSRNAGRDAVDASGAKDESTSIADGEVVWS
jgi:hypothetical protein